MIQFDTYGVIGHTGMVGGATYRWFQDRYGKDKVLGHSRSNPDLDAMKADVVFVCVPTPYDWEKQKFDGSIVEQVLGEISELKPEAVVVIKSTIPVGSTEKWQEQFPSLYLLFNPEFLSEASNDTDFANPDRQFVGYTERSYEYATQVLHALPNSPYDIIVPSKEAELLKYINNTYGMLQVAYANHVYDVCEAEELDYDRVIKAAQASKWVGAPMGRNYFNVMHKGFRGFGGACFPKDINAWLEYCEKNNINSQLLDTVRNVNRELLKGQGYTEADAEKL